jgi:hypothetical protein
MTTAEKLNRIGRLSMPFFLFMPGSFPDKRFVCSKEDFNFVPLDANNCPDDSNGCWYPLPQITSVP